ncbi:MAG TPA: phosphoribosyl-ATP diphosphatase [Gemmatimonadales bacterium]|nr:phosphoribosyl-ATP diphosphatase [Gemmatimonadales bacterium]
MIVASIDVMSGRAVQLRQGRELMLDGGDPLARLDEFAVAGEVAVVDLDAARGHGSNADLLREMVRRAPCRVGGGIRSLDAARAWLDAGAAKIVLGTAASAELCARLPRERVIAAVDAEGGEVVVDGWRTRTGVSVLERIAQLAPTVGGFLFTQVEREGTMGGCDLDAVRRVVAAAGGARVTAAGGITTPAEIAELDRLGADAQVGMALYTGRLSLGSALAAPLARPVEDGVWPTVVCDELGRTLGLVWSTRESLERAVTERRGIYWSRSRSAVWVKGETSGSTQELLRVDLDCDRDALRFTVRQHGIGFCHREHRSCWPSGFDLGDLERVISARRERPELGSGTARLLSDPTLLRAKLCEEAGELADAATPAAAVHEAADLLYMAFVALGRTGGTLAGVRAELERRHGAVSRRPMEAK